MRIGILFLLTLCGVSSHRLLSLPRSGPLVCPRSNKLRVKITSGTGRTENYVCKKCSGAACDHSTCHTRYVISESLLARLTDNSYMKFTITEDKMWTVLFSNEELNEVGSQPTCDKNNGDFGDSDKEDDEDEDDDDLESAVQCRWNATQSMTPSLRLSKNMPGGLAVCEFRCPPGRAGECDNNTSIQIRTELFEDGSNFAKGNIFACFASRILRRGDGSYKTFDTACIYQPDDGGDLITDRFDKTQDIHEWRRAIHTARELVSSESQPDINSKRIGVILTTLDKSLTNISQPTLDDVKNTALFLDAVLDKTDANDTDPLAPVECGERVMDPMLDVLEWLGRGLMDSPGYDKLNQSNNWNTSNIDILSQSDLVDEEKDVDSVFFPSLPFGESAIMRIKPPANLKSCAQNNSYMASSIVSVQFEESVDLTEQPLIINFTFKQFIDTINQTMEPVAVFWNSSMLEWQSLGCSVLNSTSTSALVSCNHTTSFAVLMKPVQQAELSSSTHAFVLNFITEIGLSVSNLFLLLTAMLHLLFVRMNRSGRTITIINLCLALFVGNILFLFGISRTKEEVLCERIAICLHYFYLVAFFAMLMEGLRLLLMLGRGIYHSKPACVLITFIVTWGLPAVVVGGTILKSGFVAYGDQYRCWLTVEGGWIWYFIGPVLGVIAINLFVMVVAIRALLRSTVELRKRGKLKTSLWNVFVLILLLGVTWIFGVFTIGEEMIFFEYLFSILNTLQGCFIFLLTCVLDRKTRKIIGNALGCREKEKRAQLPELMLTAASNRRPGVVEGASPRARQRNNSPKVKPASPGFNRGYLSSQSTVEEKLGTTYF